MVEAVDAYLSRYEDDVIVKYRPCGDKCKAETEVMVFTKDGEQLMESKSVNLMYWDDANPIPLRSLDKYKLWRVNIKAMAEKILQSLESDVELVPSNIADWWTNYLHEHYNRYLDTLSFLDKSDMKRKILEIGSLPGHFTVLLKRLSYDVRGVDIDPTRVKQLWDKYNILVDEVDIEQESLPFPPNSFDIVLFAEILEHLRLNPLHALREVYRVLKPNGRIILSTPNITPIHRLLFLFGKSYQGSPVEEFKKLKWLGHMGHIRLYSLEEVKDFLEYIGFRICSYTYKNYRSKIPEGRKIKIMTLIKKHFHSSLYMVAKKK